MKIFYAFPFSFLLNMHPDILGRQVNKITAWILLILDSNQNSILHKNDKQKIRFD